MTDQELRDLVAGLAVSQAKTDAQMLKTDAQLAKTDAQLAKTDAQLAETDAQLAETAAQILKTSTKVDRVAEMYGGVSNNQGDVAEEFFFNSLKANLTLNGIKFDHINKNMTRCNNGSEGEYDIVLINGKEIFIIEVKYKAHQADLDRLLNQKAPTFDILYPEYQNYIKHLGLASFSINDVLKRRALEKHVTVLQRKGELIESIAA
ncbi:MAG: hypothetical protein A6F72_07550 [Cycloclasticus sp. symbiont of Poecilosclerida sp. N]|nr:MAG: hypothetical protein A6F72_07550 [Cycloclasticus sp. symbiont of Poecilosclerida sp. N]